MRGELTGRAEVWDELARRGATIATVAFSGRTGTGGRTERIALLHADGDELIEVELWERGRDELCHALEAPVFDRFGSFVGHPPMRGQVRWLAPERVVEIVATRATTRLEERAR